LTMASFSVADHVLRCFVIFLRNFVPLKLQNSCPTI